MERVVSLEINNNVYFYCGWYQFEKERYPKYTMNKDVALKFLNRAYALNMQRTNSGYILLEDRLELIDESIIKIG